jgi:hypothetical protein
MTNGLCIVRPLDDPATDGPVKFHAEGERDVFGFDQRLGVGATDVTSGQGPVQERIVRNNGGLVFVTDIKGYSIRAGQALQQFIMGLQEITGFTTGGIIFVSHISVNPIVNGFTTHPGRLPGHPGMIPG